MTKAFLTLEPAQNLNQALLAAIDKYAERTCLHIKQDGHYQSISYRHFQTLTFRMVRFLHQLGIANGERIAIAADNCLEWLVVYIATLLAGGVAIPLRPSLAPETFQFTLADSEACLIVLQDNYLLETIARLFDSDNNNQLANLKTILVINEGDELPSGMTSLTTILAEAEPLTAQEIEAIRVYAAHAAPETLAAIHYTAGETGRPKGAVFSQAQRLASMQRMAAWLKLEEDERAFTIIPWSFAASLNVTLYYFLSGVANVVAEGVETALASMQQTSPTIALCMPYFLERFYDEFMSMVAQMPEASREVFQWAVAKGREFHAAGPAASEELREEYARADLTFFTQLRGQIGGRMRRFYSAGAPLAENVASFFEAIGLPVLNVYSLTEAGGFPAVSQLHARRSGSCGCAAPGFEICLADDNEVLVRAESIMSEYWGWPADMYQMLDAEGWLHTGDLGRFDEEGYLYLIGRKQPLIVLSTGRKVMPGVIEKALMASPFIAQAAIFGEGRPYISALIVPNLEALADHFRSGQEDRGETIVAAPASTSLKWIWARDTEDREPLITTAHPRVKALLDNIIAEINHHLDLGEQIKVYSLLDQAGSKAANELAELMPAGRHVIAERYAAQIEAMYPLASRIGEKQVTKVLVKPERMRELLEKESILDAWMADAGIEFLFNLARAKQIDAPSVVHICDTVATIAQMESEERPLSTAFIVGDPVRIARVLPRSEIQLLRWDHIRRMRHVLITLAKMVDGLVLGYVVDKHGYIRGIRKLKLDQPLDDTPNLLLGPQFRRHAAISELCDAVVFFVPTGGRQVRVFAEGQLVGRYSNGDWSPDRMHRVEELVKRMAEQKNYNLNLIRRVLRCAFQMSEENMGTIFIIGNAETILTHSDAPEISPFASIVSTDIDYLSDSELINFAKQDGATVIDMQGRFRGCMILLRPGAETQAEIGPGKGARHSSAAKMSAEAQCLAITVSQDGPITIYDNGRRVLSL